MTMRTFYVILVSAVCTLTLRALPFVLFRKDKAMGDLVRGALTSIPAHQRESGAALGLTRWQINRYVLIPQTLRRLIPQAINLATRMIKTTSLAMLIGVVEVLKISQQIIDASRYDAPQAAVFIYGVVFLMYFMVCWPISLLAGRLEKRWKE